MIYIVTTFIGCLAVDEENKLVSYKLFHKDAREVAKKLNRSNKEIIPEEKQLVEELKKKGYKKIFFPFKKNGVKFVKKSEAVEDFVRNNLFKIAVEKNFVKDQIEFNKFLTRVNSELTRLKIKSKVTRDNLIIQTIRAIEEIDKSINIFVERLREWYGLHFPEMDRAISNHEKFVKIVYKFGSRDKIQDPELSQIKDKSMGADFPKKDIDVIQHFAKGILELYELKDKLSDYLEKLCKEIIPNFTELAGPNLAAKMVAKAGGVDKLAKMPSSTIQLLGAEKALFRHLHGRGKPPKFGLLFNHPIIQKSPKKHRGKVARVLSAKLSMAIKLDFYSKKYKADELKKELQERIKTILKG